MDFFRMLARRLSIAIFVSMVKNPLIDNLRLDGGVLCLDFVNTIPDRFDGSNRDHLQSFNDLIYWARKAKMIDSGGSASLEKLANGNERKAKDFFTEAIQLRSLIYSLFHPVSQQQRLKASDLEQFNKLVSKYFPFLQLAVERDGFAEQWNFESNHFYSITAPIVKSAYELLLSDKLHRVKQCPNCGWLFLDTTKNGKRRWCSMQDCGSAVKALEYYYRKKEQK
jgi:predicted RNA-binding Zn ribbon-like protein